MCETPNPKRNKEGPRKDGAYSDRGGRKGLDVTEGVAGLGGREEDYASGCVLGVSAADKDIA